MFGGSTEKVHVSHPGGTKSGSIYKTANSSRSKDIVYLKLIWQRDLGHEIEHDKWIKIVAECGRYMREARRKLTQYKVLQRFYYTPSRLYTMKLSNDYLCWKCRTEKGTFFHCIWECVLLRPLWVQVLRILSSWLGSEIPPRPELCLPGDKTYLSNVSKCDFSVISVGTITACRIILRHWKTSDVPQVKEWANAMVETASYESMLSRLSDTQRDGEVSPWDRFWSHIKVDDLNK